MARHTPNSRHLHASTGPSGVFRRYHVQEDPINLIDPFGLEGHHYFPKSIWRDLPLSKEVKRVFDKATTGEIPGGHGWSKAHKIYNNSVKELWEEFLEDNALKPCDVDADTAKQFLSRIKGSKKKGIKAFLWGISQAQKLGSQINMKLVILPGFGLSSIDAAFRQDPIGTLELLMDD